MHTCVFDTVCGKVEVHTKLKCGSCLLTAKVHAYIVKQKLEVVYMKEWAVSRVLEIGGPSWDGRVQIYTLYMHVHIPLATVKYANTASTLPNGLGLITQGRSLDLPR